jgi:hypothetical protein
MKSPTCSGVIRGVFHCLCHRSTRNHPSGLCPMHRKAVAEGTATVPTTKADDEKRLLRREGARAAFRWLLDILAQGTASPEQATKAIERIRETMERLEAGEPVRLGEETL